MRRRLSASWARPQTGPMLAIAALGVAAVCAISEVGAAPPGLLPGKAESGCVALEPNRSAPPTVSSALVSFPVPQRFAIVGASHGKRRHLYGAGDLIPSGRPDGQGLRVESVLPDALVLGHPGRGSSVRMGVGVVIPESGGRRLEGTALLEAVEYAYVASATAPELEPRLVRIQDRCARLEVDRVPPAPVPPVATASAGQRRVPPPLEDAIGENLRVTAVGPNAYEVRVMDAQAAREHGTQAFMEAVPTIRPTVSLDNGVGFHVRSAVADGTFGSQGFRVDSPKLAERAGLEAGDVITAVNGQPVSGFGDVYRLYQQAKRDQAISSIAVELQRHGQLMTKTYRIR